MMKERLFTAERIVLNRLFTKLLYEKTATALANNKKIVLVFPGNGASKTPGVNC